VNFTYSQTAFKHEENDSSVSWIVNMGKKRFDVGVFHISREGMGFTKSMPWKDRANRWRVTGNRQKIIEGSDRRKSAIYAGMTVPFLKVVGDVTFYILW
jgi:hypothetical protein